METDDERGDRELRPVGDGGADAPRIFYDEGLIDPDIELQPEPGRRGGVLGFRKVTGICRRCNRARPLAELRTFVKVANPSEGYGREAPVPVFREPSGVIVSCIYCLLPDELIHEFGAAALVVLDALGALLREDLKDGDEHPMAREQANALDRVHNTIYYKLGFGSSTGRAALSQTVRPSEFRRAYDLGRADGIAESRSTAEETDRCETFIVKGSMPDPALAATTLMHKLREYEGVRQVMVAILPDENEINPYLHVVVNYGPTCSGEFDDSALFILERELNLTELEIERLGVETVERDVTPKEWPASYVWTLAHTLGRDPDEALKIYGRAMERINKEPERGEMTLLVATVGAAARDIHAKSEPIDKTSDLWRLSLEFAEVNVRHVRPDEFAEELYWRLASKGIGATQVDALRVGKSMLKERL